MRQNKYTVCLRFKKVKKNILLSMFLSMLQQKFNKQITFFSVVWQEKVINTKVSLGYQDEAEKYCIQIA